MRIKSSGYRDYESPTDARGVLSSNRLIRDALKHGKSLAIGRQRGSADRVSPSAKRWVLFARKRRTGSGPPPSKVAGTEHVDCYWECGAICE